MYWIKLFGILSTVMLTSISPMLALMGINEMVAPHTCWAQDYSEIMPFVSGASVVFGVIVAEKLFKKLK